MRKTSLFAAFLAIILAGTGARSARAAGACDLTVQVAELTAIQTNTSMDELEQLRVEIIARHKLLSAAIDCDQAEIAVRVEALGNLPDKIKLFPAYRNILENLAQASNYYEDRKISIQTMGVWDLKTSSRAITAWRQATFIPTITWADDLLLWVDNQQFLERASERLDQVSRVAFSLKLINQKEINELFEKAKNNFNTAFIENDRAKNALNQGRAGIALTHTQTSLKALADTYQVFFDLQKALQKI